MSSQETFNQMVPEDYYGRILTGNYSAGLKEHVAGYISAYKAFEKTGNPTIFYLSAWHEENEGRVWYEFVSRRFARFMGCERSEVAETFRNRVLDQRTITTRDAEVGLEEEIRDRESLGEAAVELREELKRRGIGDAVYKVRLGKNRTAWIKDVARIEVHEKDRICLSCGYLTLVTKERKAEEQRLERERLRVSLEMAGAVCHEMNQPVQSISGYAETLLLKLSEEDPMRDQLTKIIDLTGKMGGITKKLARITRYETKDYVQGVKIVDIEKSSEEFRR